MKGGIYGIKNLIDNKWYIGQSINISIRKGRKLTEQAKEKLRIFHLGKKRSEETKRKMSEAAQKRKNLC